MAIDNNHHLKGLTHEHVGELTILVGDPDRVYLLATLLSHTETVVKNREFICISGLFNSTRISIASTGIGAGSTEIAVIELIQSGAKQLIRVGGCGAWKDNINPGDIIMNSGMARSPGMLGSYVPDNYPAVADPCLFHQVFQYLTKNNRIIHHGIGFTAEGFYLSQGRNLNLFEPDDGKDKLNYWRKRNILNAEMETAVIYLLASLYQIPATNCLVAHVARNTEQWVSDADYQSIHLATAKLVIESIIATNQQGHNK